MAVKNLKTQIRCLHFDGGNPRRSGFDLVSFTGGYSIVYPIDVGKNTLVLRCWLKDVGNARLRYQKAQKYLEENSLTYFVDFEYVEKGIFAGTKVWPILYMQWVSGLRLNHYLDKYIDNTECIQLIADQFTELVNQLHQKKISHGDLQDGNIIIYEYKSSPKLRLIDYDSLYVPTLQNTERVLHGVPGYQHPLRQTNKLEDTKADYFSELVIYLSLCAYLEQPELWKTQTEQQLLFTKEDFINPDRSEIFAKLSRLSSEVQFLSNKLKEYCKGSDLNRFLPLEQILSQFRPTIATPKIQNYFNQTRPQTSVPTRESPPKPPKRKPIPTIVICPSCNWSNEITEIYCQNPNGCLQPLVSQKVCPGCRRSVPAGKFCTHCGHKL